MYSPIKRHRDLPDTSGKRKGEKDETTSDKKSCLTEFLNWTSNPHDPLLSNVDVRLIDAHIQHLKTQAKGRGNRVGQKLSTVYKKHGFLNHFFTEMKSAGYLSQSHILPTTGIRVFDRKGRHGYQKKNRFELFSPAELDVIFEPNNLLTQRKPHEFWMPIIALYTGARINEIAQLKLTDIKKVDDLWVFDINDEDGNSLKSESSVRAIPIHPILLELGFIEYIEDVRNLSGAIRVFPYLRNDSKGFADVPSEAFARYLLAIGVKAEGKTFHSFRSTLIEHMRDRACDLELRQYYVGHSIDSVEDRHYLTMPAAIVFFEHVTPKITFRSVESNLKELYRPPGHFVDVLTREMGKRLRYDKTKKQRKAKGLPVLRSKHNKTKG